MSPEQVFLIANVIAISGWVILIFAGRARWAARLVSGAVLPLLLGVLYLGLIFLHWSESEGGFSTLADVQLLFANPWLLLAGWIHYLAFDLFVGSWEVRDAKEHGIPHLMTVPSLILTFLFGPVGLLLYFLIRTLRVRALTL